MNYFIIKRIVSGSTLAAVLCISQAAQTTGQSNAPANQATANENFELNIASDRITETNFARSTAVELTQTTSGNVRLEVGVGVRAERIDVILRGITGRVTFRGSLESIRRRIERIKAAPNQQILPPL